MVLAPISITHTYSSKGRLEPADRLVFQHFTKTGGTTVNSCLTPLFDPSEICPERFGRFALWPKALLERYRFFSSHCTARQIQYIPSPVKTIAFFRHLIERCISLYYYWRSIQNQDETEVYILEPRFARSLSPREFFAITDIEQCRHYRNAYTSGLAGDALFASDGRLWRSDDELLEAALERLDQLAFIGISEDMAGSMDALCRQLDIPNLYVGQFHMVTPREDALGSDPAADLDAECLGLIEQANALDMIVYERALTIALGGRQLSRAIGCVTGQMPSCNVRKRYAETWVENRAGGYVLYGPRCRLLPGRWVVTFRFRPRHGGREDWRGDSMGHIEVAARKGELVIARQNLPAAFGAAEDVREQIIFDLGYVVSDVEFRVWAFPGAPVDVEATVMLQSAEPSSSCAIGA
jgi:hypothetical protein